MPTAVEATAARLQAAVATHKAAIARHRRQLHAAKAALQQFEHDCRRRGIRIVLVPVVPDEGGLHGQASPDRTEEIRSPSHS